MGNEVNFGLKVSKSGAPDIVAAILDDVLPNHITLFDLAVDPPALWEEQRGRLAGAAAGRFRSSLAAPLA